MVDGKNKKVLFINDIEQNGKTVTFNEMAPVPRVMQLGKFLVLIQRIFMACCRGWKK